MPQALHARRMAHRPMSEYVIRFVDCHKDGEQAVRITGEQISKEAGPAVGVGESMLETAKRCRDEARKLIDAERLAERQ